MGLRLFLFSAVFGLQFFVKPFASAAIVNYLENSKLPISFQAPIVTALNTNCSDIVSVSEVNTNLRVERVDQGIFNIYYTTEFIASWSVDLGVYKSARILIKTVHWNAANPEIARFELLELDDSERLCQ